MDGNFQTIFKKNFPHLLPATGPLHIAENLGHTAMPAIGSHMHSLGLWSFIVAVCKLGEHPWMCLVLTCD